MAVSPAGLRHSFSRVRPLSAPAARHEGAAAGLRGTALRPGTPDWHVHQMAVSRDPGSLEWAAGRPPGFGQRAPKTLEQKLAWESWKITLLSLLFLL